METPKKLVTLTNGRRYKPASVRSALKHYSIALTVWNFDGDFAAVRKQVARGDFDGFIFPTTPRTKGQKGFPAKQQRTRRA